MQGFILYNVDKKSNKISREYGRWNDKILYRYYQYDNTYSPHSLML